MFCSKCGYELTGNGNFCSSCGTKQVKIAPANRAPAQNQPVTQMKAPEFQVDTSKATRFWGIILVACSFLVLGINVFLAVITVLVGDSMRTKVAGATVFIALGITFFFTILVIAILLFTVGKQRVFVTGRQMVVKQLWGKKKYDCSDVVCINCDRKQVKNRWVYSIEWSYRDQRKYRVSSEEEGFCNIAAYFYNMVNGGTISENAVAMHKDILRRYARKEWPVEAVPVSGTPMSNRPVANATLPKREIPQIQPFKISSDKTFKYLGILLAVCGVLMLGVLGLALVIDFLQNNTITIGAVLSIFLFGFLVILCIVGSICAFTVCKLAIFVTGRQIVVKEYSRKKQYDCSDIVAISCGRYQLRYSYVYYIQWSFRDMKSYRVHYGEEGFKEAAGYFYKMINSGFISENAVTPENKEMLRKYEVQAW